MSDLPSRVGFLLILTGSAASGKDAVISKLLQVNPEFKRVTTFTTRTPRPGEQDGLDYQFVTREQFQTLQQNNQFLETVNYAGNFYGTLKKDVEKVLSGQKLVWITEGSLAGKVREVIKNTFPPPVSDHLINQTMVVYLQVKSSTRQERLKGRGMSEEEIKQRTSQDEKSWQNGQFDYVVENIDGKLNQTVEKITRLIKITYK